MNIDWFITNLCDQARYCKFCNAPWNAFPKDSTLSQALNLCDRLSEFGATTVTICGGEPFMFPGLEQIVSRLSFHNIKVILYTSATSQLANLDQMLPYLYFLSLPVDAVTPECIKRMRGENQFARVKSLLDRISATPQPPQIKIGTVVSRQNLSDLEHIHQFLLQFRPVTVWRLYQFSPSGIGKYNQDLFLLPNSEFASAAERLKKLNAVNTHSLRIAERTRDDILGYCMIMDSVGGFWRYDETYVSLGLSIFDDPKIVAGNYNSEKHLVQKAWHK